MEELIAKVTLIISNSINVIGASSSPRCGDAFAVNNAIPSTSTTRFWHLHFPQIVILGLYQSC